MTEAIPSDASDERIKQLVREEVARLTKPLIDDLNELMATLRELHHRHDKEADRLAALLLAATQLNRSDEGTA